MPNKELRRHARRLLVELLRLGWTDEHGEGKFMQARCVEISPTGLRLETRDPIPLRASVSLRAERINLCGTGSVRHIRRTGSKFVIGLELSQTLDLETLDRASAR